MGHDNFVGFFSEYLFYYYYFNFFNFHLFFLFIFVFCFCFYFILKLGPCCNPHSICRNTGFLLGGFLWKYCAFNLSTFNWKAILQFFGKGFRFSEFIFPKLDNGERSKFPEIVALKIPRTVFKENLCFFWWL